MGDKLIDEGIINNVYDFLNLHIVDMNRKYSFGNAGDLIKIVMAYLEKKAVYQVWEVSLDVPQRDDWPGWGHVGTHNKVGRNFWNWVHYHFPGSELYFSDKPDFSGTFQGGSLTEPVDFFGDVGAISPKAFLDTMPDMQAGDKWITLKGDGDLQVVLRLLEGFGHFEEFEKYIESIAHMGEKKSQPKRTKATIASGISLETYGQHVNAQSEELMREFYDHYAEYIKLHPNDKDKRNEIFQAWVIQKVAGLQLSIMGIAERFNSYVRDQSD